MHITLIPFLSQLQLPTPNSKNIKTSTTTLCCILTKNTPPLFYLSLLFPKILVFYIYFVAMTMNPQAVVLATAMVVSSTVLFLAFGKQKFSNFSSHDSQHDPPGQTLRSCLYSDEKKRQKKKKRVHFAENVKDTRGNGEEYRREHNKKYLTSKVDRFCRSEIPRGMPANRVALYNGILRDRVHRMECSY